MLSRIRDHRSILAYIRPSISFIFISMRWNWCSSFLSSRIYHTTGHDNSVRGPYSGKLHWLSTFHTAGERNSDRHTWFDRTGWCRTINIGLSIEWNTPWCCLPERSGLALFESTTSFLPETAASPSFIFTEIKQHCFASHFERPWHQWLPVLHDSDFILPIKSCSGNPISVLSFIWSAQKCGLWLC